jgi:serine-type D-Ala-D-Ala carboxypeptidase/endopeptidase (penicillin-binding protein 4)
LPFLSSHNFPFALPPQAIAPILSAVTVLTMQFGVVYPGQAQASSPLTANRRSSNQVCPQDLPRAIDAIIQQPTYRTATWGIQIESIDYQTELYSHNANKLLIPASNIKLFTTAAALRATSENAQNRWQSFHQDIKVVNRESDNDYADDVLYRIGGIRQTKAKLSQLSIPDQALHQVDGSGLSRDNATTPAAIVTLLKSMRHTSEYAEFYESLPIAGVNGTLENRFINTSVQGRVRAKTGTLTGVRALSGYFEHPTYGQIVFSLLVNQTDRGDSLRRGIDEIVTTLGNLTPCN